MSDPLKLQFIIEAVDKATAPVRAIAENARGFARDITSSFSGMASAAQKFGQSYGGIAAAIGGGLELRDIVGQQDIFNRLRVQYGMTEAAAKSLHSTLLDVAQDAKAPLDEMLASLEGFQKAGGDVAKFANDAKTAAAAVQLLGGQGQQVGQMIAGLHKQLGIDDVSGSIATLYEQTKMAPGGFSALASNLNSLASQYAALGHTGSGAARDLGAVYAVIAEGTRGTVRQAGSEMVEFMSRLTDPGFKSALAAMGAIPASDVDRIKMQTSIADVLRGIVAYAGKSDDNAFLAGQFLGPNLLRDLAPALTNPGLLDQKLGASGDPAKFYADATQAGQSLSGSLNELKTNIDKVAESWLTLPFKWLADGIDFAHGAFAALIVVLGGLSILGNVVPWFWSGGVAVYQFGAAALALATGVLPAVAAGFGVVGAAIEATPVGWLLTAIAAIVTALYGLFELFDHWRRIKDDFLKGMTTADGGIVDPVSGIYVPPLAGGSANDNRAASNRNDPRGIRNNNPGNLRRWGGASVVDGYATFPTADAGIAAMTDNLRSYGRQGIDTIAGIVNKWAPGSDGNNVASYIADMVKQTGFAAGQHLNMTDPSVLALLDRGIIQHENGKDPYDAQTIANAVNRAPTLGGVKGGAGTTVGGKVVVSFENAPAGASVKSVKSDNPDIGLDVDMGYSMLGAF